MEDRLSSALIANWINWTAAQDFSATQALTEITDTNAASLPHRFCRAYARP